MTGTFLITKRAGVRAARRCRFGLGLRFFAATRDQAESKKPANLNSWDLLYSWPIMRDTNCDKPMKSFWISDIGLTFLSISESIAV